MALYTITNLSAGVLVLPPPLSRRLNRYETLSFNAPAGITESSVTLNRKYSALVAMVRSGVIRLHTVEAGTVSNHVEVATVSMLSSSGLYRAVPNASVRDAVPAEDRTEGMLVRTNDTEKYYALEADLLTWTLQFSSAGAFRTGIYLIGTQDGVNRIFSTPESFLHQSGGQSIDVFHNGRRLIGTDLNTPIAGDFRIISSFGIGTGIQFLRFSPSVGSVVVSNYTIP